MKNFILLLLTAFLLSCSGFGDANKVPDKVTGEKQEIAVEKDNLKVEDNNSIERRVAAGDTLATVVKAADSIGEVTVNERLKTNAATQDTISTIVKKAVDKE